MKQYLHDHKILIQGKPWAVGFLMVFSSVLAAPESMAEEAVSGHWGQWKALDSGYMARRREAPRSINTQPQSIQSMSAMLYSTQRSKEKESKKEAASALWLYTRGETVQMITVEQLSEGLGKNVKTVRNRLKRGALLLTKAASAEATDAMQPVAWYYDTDADAVLFAAEAFSSFYTDDNAYRIRFGGKRSSLAKPMLVENGAAPKETAQSVPFRDILKFEQEPDYMYSTWTVAEEPDADYWFWDYLYAGSKDSIEVNLEIPDPAPTGDAQLRVTLRGWTDLLEGDDHSVYALINGQSIAGAEVSWDGFEEAVLVADFAQSLLDPEGHNRLTLVTDYAAGTTPGEWLDEVEIEYQRQPVARGGMLSLRGAEAGLQTVSRFGGDGIRHRGIGTDGATIFLQTVSGFSSDDILVMEDPDGETVLRKDVLIQPDGQGGWAVTFEAEHGQDYLLVQRDVIGHPVVVEDTRVNLKKRSNRADYLIIAPESFAQTAEALAELRSRDFSEVKIVWLEDIYRDFSAGRNDPKALGRFMQEVMKSWNVKPSHVVLVGKGSLDEKDRMNYGDSFLPVLLSSTPWALAASDSRLLGYEKGAPFAIGRLPITSEAEGLAYVDKLAVYESTTPGEEVFSAVLVADNPDDAGDFPANSDELASRLQSALDFNQVSKLYHPDDDVRSALIDSDTWETGYVNYDGHGSASQVGDYREKFIAAEDAAALQNNLYPLFTALTCGAGDDSLPGMRSLAAALVINPDGGAIASFAPTGLSLDADAQILGNAYVDALYLEDASIGEAARQAKADTGESISAFMSPMYSVIGDPAVKAR